MKVLVINAGSSSIKYQLFSMAQETVLAKGNIERIGEVVPDHAAAFQQIIDQLLGGPIASLAEIQAVGHRVVHGGEGFTDSARITDDVLEAIRACVPLAPLHNPPNLTGIEAACRLLPEAPHVAVFDTAFHQTMPREAYTYAIPYDLYKQHHIRRYGFHGTSHKYVSQRAAELLGRTPGDGFRVITCHLGNGCSMAAVRDGHCVDTSMGLTPLEGLVMGTRSGDIDPAITFHLADVLNMPFADINTLLNKESGLLGISGLSNDQRTISEAADSGNERARLALDVFCYRVRKYIGAYMAALGGADAVVFTGGIGENACQRRADICRGLAGLGIEIDEKRNDGLRGQEADLSTDGSGVRVLVIPTNEELVIARDTARIAAAG